MGGRLGRVQRFATKVDQGMPERLPRVDQLCAGGMAPSPARRARRLRPQPVRRIVAATRGAKTLDRLLALNAETYLVDDLLVKMDRTSMAHSLEVRSPFLDTALVEFAARLPPSLKARGLSLKRVLKRSVADLLPPEILNRRKRGFGVPLDRWFRRTCSVTQTRCSAPMLVYAPT